MPTHPVLFVTNPRRAFVEIRISRWTRWEIPLLAGITALGGARRSIFPPESRLGLLENAGVGLAVGLLTVFLLPGLLRLLGDLFDGQGTIAELRTAICWAAIPDLLFAVIWIPPTIVWDWEAAPVAVTAALEGLATGASIWSLALGLVFVSQAHRFGIMKSIATVFLAALGVGAVVLTVGFALGFVQGMAS